MSALLSLDPSTHSSTAYNPSLLTPDQVRSALAVRDLTDPGLGPHAVQLLVDAVEEAVRRTWSVPVIRHRASPVVPVADNYDRLGYAPDAVARDARYSRYLRRDVMLRAHTTAAIPNLLQELALAGPADIIVSLPGICYRRDSIDRQHVGEPHQQDVWWIRQSGQPLEVADLDRLLDVVLAAVLPGRHWRTVPAAHPYTVDGRQVDVDGRRQGWVEVGECGLAHPRLLAAAGLPDSSSGLALGLGLDRLVMLRKGIDDIRLLRSEDPRVAAQLTDLQPYRPVSAQPPVRRDLSLAVAADADVEVLGDRVRSALGADAAVVEEMAIVSETPGAALPQRARERLGLLPGQKNVLLRLVLRDLDRTLTDADANELRDRAYAALHEGTAGVVPC